MAVPMPAVPSKTSLINCLGNVEEVEVLCRVRLEWHLTTWRVRRQVLENIFTGDLTAETCNVTADHEVCHWLRIYSNCCLMCH